MKVGIIETGGPPPALVTAFGSYASMIDRLLGDNHAFEAFRAMDGDLPPLGRFDALVITGSACSVYDRLPWIEALKDFLLRARGHVRLVGICFGHQIMAAAFGGRVAKAPQGWGLGLHRYEILHRERWMDEADAIYGIASHQDQIVDPPPASRTLAASDLTPHAIVSYQDHPSISVQFHPEFEPPYSRALFAGRRAPDLDEEAINRAIGSLAGNNDNVRVGRWINAFLANPDLPGSDRWQSR